MQAIPSAQSALVLHAELQVPLSQRYFPQGCASEGPHAPSPSQDRPVFMVVAFAQVDAPHGLLEGYSAHEPKPSHTPVLPQVVGSSRMHSG